MKEISFKTEVEIRVEKERWRYNKMGTDKKEWGLVLRKTASALNKWKHEGHRWSASSQNVFFFF